MSIALAQRLITSGAVSASDAEAALLSSLARRVPFVRALIDTGAIAEAILDQELEALGGVGLRQVSGVPELVNRLPPHFCRRMGVLPVRVDHGARVVEVAAADPLDPHVAAEVTFHLGVPVRVLRAPMSAIEDAIRRIELEAEAAAGRTRRATPPFPHGAPESSNPPPPPQERPIPLVKKAKPEKAPDTLKLYKQTGHPEEGADLDFCDAPNGARAEKSNEIAASLASPLPDSLTEMPRTLRGTAPQTLPETPPAAPRSPLPAPGALALHAADEPATALEVPTEPPPSSPIAEVEVEVEVEPAQSDAEPIVAAEPVRSGAEPPAVSFPSMPPPSIVEEPALLAAEPLWAAAAPAESASPPPPPAKPQRKPSRFARPAIDIHIPQPPSERARRARSTTWDVSIGQDPNDAPADDEPDSSKIAVEPAPARVDRLDLGPIHEVLRVAGSRDDVVVAALRGLRTVGRRTAVFVVRRSGFHGWACNVELGDEQTLRNVAIPHDAPSVFATAVAAGSYFGPIPANAVHAGLVAVLEEPASDVAAAVVRAGGKPVMVLFADDLIDQKRLVLPRLLEIAGAVGAALSRLLAARL